MHDNSLDDGIRQRMQRIESLLREAEQMPDPKAKARTRELMQAVLDLHGAGLEKILEHLAGTDAGAALIDALGRDELVGGLFLLHGLHPVDLETRVRQALDKVRPYLRSHGGNVELLSAADGKVRLRMEGSCHGCPSSAVTLKLAIEEAIYAAAPDLAALEVEGVVEPKPAPHSTFIPVEELAGSNGARARRSGWEEVSDLSASGVQTRVVGGRSVVFCRLGETLYAYDNACPDCGKPLDAAVLTGEALACPACGQSFDIVGAGRGLKDPAFRLEPFPLLVEHGRTRVALNSMLDAAGAASA